MDLIPHERMLNAIVDRIIPRDGWEAGWDGGVLDFVQTQWERDLTWSHEPLTRLFDFLTTACAEGAAFVDRDASGQDQLLEASATDPTSAEGYRAAVRIAMEGYYGGGHSSRPAGWVMMGFDPGPSSEETSRIRAVEPAALNARYDVVIVGSGLGGAVAASELSASGLHVLVVERGPLHTTAQLRSDHLHGKRLSVYAPTAGPGAGNPRATVLADGAVWSCDATEGGDRWGLVAMTVGGGTRLWQGMAWRMFAEDFAMASTYGPRKGADILDWPVSYDDMEPFYSDAEWELGVAGDDVALSQRTPRSRPYPMPPMPDDAVRRLFGTAAERLGVCTGPIPFAINTETRDGRPPCAGCGQCVGHACPVNAKNGAHNTFLTRALRTGRCDLLVNAPVVEITHRDQRADGVRVLMEGVERSIACERVVVSAGAIETPRLLLASGLGNDNVGRFLHGHSGTLVMGLAPEPVGLARSPGHSIATLDYVHNGTAPIGGGVVFDMFSPYPLMLSSLAALFGGGFSGRTHKEWMRDTAPRLVGLMSMAQELSSPEGRVRLHPTLIDRNGMQAPIVTGPKVEATEQNRQYLTEQCMAWLRETGCEQPTDAAAVFADSLAKPKIPATEHSAGTARMADDPSRGATDRYGRLHGSPNVFVCDAALLPSSGGVNPALTIVANALRVARSWSGRSGVPT